MKSIILICLCVASVWASPFAARKSVPVQKYPPGGRIIGGNTAQDKQFPWQVAVYYDNSEGSFFGGGALVAPNWVLTAGHITHEAKEFTLHLGANSLVDNDTHRVTVGTGHSITHPQFNPTTLENDIGLIKIDSEIKLNDYIQVIPLATSPLESGSIVIVSGWGATGDWDGASNDLNYVDLDVISNEDCRNVYGEAVTDGMVCAIGATNEGICLGDSGGPLITPNPAGTPVLVGIASWASPHGCETDHPSAFTRTATYAQWIQSEIA